MKPIQIATAAALATVVACGSPREKSTNTGNTTGVNPNSTPNFNPNNGSATDIERRLWAEICKAAFTCPDVQPELLLVVGRFASQQECIATGDFPGLELDNNQLQASIDAGRARWDQAKADQCFAALQAELCAGGTFDNIPTCDDVVTGLVAEGDPCASDEECMAGLQCQTGETCAGVCAPNCGSDQCTGSEICDFQTDACKAPGGAGDQCIWDGDCADTLFCDDVDTCSAGGTVAEGGACGSRQECMSDLSCVGGTCRSVMRLDAGATCTFGAEITAVCKAGTVCTNLAIDGQQAVGTCAAPQAEGGACRVSFECAWGLGCSSSSPLEIGTCVPTLPAGSACTDDAQCQSYNCTGDACAAPRTNEVCQL